MDFALIVDVFLVGILVVLMAISSIVVLIVIPPFTRWGYVQVTKMFGH